MDARLQAFVAVARYSNFTRAADSLHLTQPAISQHIHALEAELGITLFDRNSKRVRLTSGGDALLPIATEIDALYSRMRQVADDLSTSVSGPLHIAASYTVGEYVLPLVIANFCEQFPGVRPTVTIHNTTEVADDVRRGLIDIGVVEGEVAHKGLIVKELVEDHMVVIAPRNHALAGQTSVSLEQFRHDRWIVREPGSGTRLAMDRWFQERQFRPKDTLVCSTTQAVKSAVEAGLGIAFISEWVVEKESALASVCTFPMDDPLTLRHFYLVQRETAAHNRAAEEFARYLYSGVILERPNGRRN